MADVEQQTPIEEIAGEDIEMVEGADAGAGVGEDIDLPEVGLELPKLVLFAE